MAKKPCEVDVCLQETGDKSYMTFEEVKKLAKEKGAGKYHGRRFTLFTKLTDGCEPAGHRGRHEPALLDVGGLAEAGQRVEVAVLGVGGRLEDDELAAGGLEAVQRVGGVLVQEHVQRVLRIELGVRGAEGLVGVHDHDEIGVQGRDDAVVRVALGAPAAGADLGRELVDVALPRAAVLDRQREGEALGLGQRRERRHPHLRVAVAHQEQAGSGSVHHGAVRGRSAEAADRRAELLLEDLALVERGRDGREASGVGGRLGRGVGGAVVDGWHHEQPGEEAHGESGDGDRPPEPVKARSSPYPGSSNAW